MSKVKKTTPLTYKLKQPHITLDTLSAIFETVNGASKNPSVKIEYYKDPTTYEYISVDDIPQDDKLVKGLRFYATLEDENSNSLSLHIMPSSTKLSLSNSTLKSRGIYESIKDILAKSENQKLYFIKKFESFIYFIVMPGFIGISIGLSNYQPEQVRLIAQIALVILAFGLFRLFLFWGFKLGRGYAITLKPGSSVKNFFQRNRDTLISQTIAAVIGGVIVWLAVKILDS